MHKIWAGAVALASLAASAQAPVFVNWDQTNMVAVASWNVFWQPTVFPGESETPIVMSNTTTRPFPIPFLMAGTNYSIYVTAVSPTGLQSEPSEAIRYTVPMPMPLPDGTPAPTNVRVTGLMPDAEFMRLGLAWQSGASNFVVAWTNASEPTGLALNTPFPRASVSGLVPGERYNLGVTAFSDTGEASESVPVRLTPAAISGGNAVLYRAQVGTLTPPIMPPLPDQMPVRTRRTAAVLQNAVTGPVFVATSERGVVAPLVLGTNQILSIINGKAYVTGK